MQGSVDVTEGADPGASGFSLIHCDTNKPREGPAKNHWVMPSWQAGKRHLKEASSALLSPRVALFFPKELPGWARWISNEAGLHFTPFSRWLFPLYPGEAASGPRLPPGGHPQVTPGDSAWPEGPALAARPAQTRGR